MYRKKNGLIRGFSKHAPLIAIVLSSLLLGGGLLTAWRMTRLSRTVKQHVHELEVLHNRLAIAEVCITPLCSGPMSSGSER